MPKQLVQHAQLCFPKPYPSFQFSQMFWFWVSHIISLGLSFHLGQIKVLSRAFMHYSGKLLHLFMTGSHVAQAGLEPTMQLRMSLPSRSSCLNMPGSWGSKPEFMHDKHVLHYQLSYIPNTSYCFKWHGHCFHHPVQQEEKVARRFSSEACLQASFWNSWQFLFLLSMHWGHNSSKPCLQTSVPCRGFFLSVTHIHWSPGGGGTSAFLHQKDSHFLSC